MQLRPAHPYPHKGQQEKKGCAEGLLVFCVLCLEALLSLRDSWLPRTVFPLTAVWVVAARNLSLCND